MRSVCYGSFIYSPFQKIRETRYQSPYGAACRIGVSVANFFKRSIVHKIVQVKIWQILKQKHLQTRCQKLKSSLSFNHFVDLLLNQIF